jgi:hypothetical protein
MTDYVSEKGAGGGLRGLLHDKAGGGWLGYRGLLALILFTPQIGLFAYWVTYTDITLGTGMFYLTLVPFMIALPLTALLPGKSGITPKTLGIVAVMALIPYTIYDWARVPMNLIFGIPFWDHWFDWGNSILGTTATGATATGTIFTYEQLTTGLVSHIMRGWGLAMGYYILVRRVTLLSVCFRLVYDHLLLDSFPSVGPYRCSSALDMVFHSLGVPYGLRPRTLGGTKNL